MQEKIVFIGGPGTGKSTIINKLKNNGYVCMPEISREITINAKKEGIDQLFLTEPLLFSKKLLEGREKQYYYANSLDSKIIFFDRGIPSIHAYMRYFKTKFPDLFLKKSKQCRYTKVFEFLPWKKIYVSDNERYETYEESIKISKYINHVYKELDYNIINVPFGDINDRYNFILNTLSIEK